MKRLSESFLDRFGLGGASQHGAPFYSRDRSGIS